MTEMRIRQQHDPSGREKFAKGYQGVNCMTCYAWYTALNAALPFGTISISGASIVFLGALFQIDKSNGAAFSVRDDISIYKDEILYAILLGPSEKTAVAAVDRIFLEDLPLPQFNFFIHHRWWKVPKLQLNCLDGVVNNQQLTNFDRCLDNNDYVALFDFESFEAFFLEKERHDDLFI